MRHTNRLNAGHSRVVRNVPLPAMRAGRRAVKKRRPRSRARRSVATDSTALARSLSLSGRRTDRRVWRARSPRRSNIATAAAAETRQMSTRLQCNGTTIRHRNAWPWPTVHRRTATVIIWPLFYEFVCSTVSSTADRPRDAPCQSKSCRLSEQVVQQTHNKSN